MFDKNKMSICDQVRLQKFWHTWRTWKILKKNLTQIYQFWNLSCNTVESLVRPKICKMFKSYTNELLQISTKDNFCEASFCENQTFLSFNFTNKVWLPTWIFDVMYYSLSGKKSNILFIKISWIQKT